MTDHGILIEVSNRRDATREFYRIRRKARDNGDTLFDELVLHQSPYSEREMYIVRTRKKETGTVDED